MYLTYIYTTNTYRMCKIRKRSLKKLSIFPVKYSRDYLDYSVDFSKFLNDGEHIVWSKVSVNSDHLIIENVYGHGPYVTGFISGGLSNHSYYLIFTAKTNQGSILSQEMILPTYGQGKVERPGLKYLALRPGIKPPTNRPPFNAVRLNNRYLLDDNGFFIGIS